MILRNKKLYNETINELDFQDMQVYIMRVVTKSWLFIPTIVRIVYNVPINLTIQTRELHKIDDF